MRTTTRLATFGAAAAIAAGVAVGACGAASAATDPGASGVFFVQNLDHNHTLAVESIETYNTAPPPALNKGAEVVPGYTSRPINVSIIDLSHFASVTVTWRVTDNNGDDNDEFTTLFWVNEDGTTVTQTSSQDSDLTLPCQVEYAVPGQSQPSQCNNDAILTFGYNPANAN
jgi:hypothetical protein